MKNKKRAKQDSMNMNQGNEIVLVTYNGMDFDTQEEIEALTMADNNMRSSVLAVEQILNYQFNKKSLLEDALTHSSYTESPSYQRLEFVGDAALGLAVANFVFITYPDLDPGDLSLLRSANISTEKLARVAIRHGLFQYVRHNAPALDAKVNEFALAIEDEVEEIITYGGSVKAPKVLADIVESIAAAIYVDCEFDLRRLWEYISPLLEPIVTVETLQQQPVTMLYELCQKQGKTLNIKHWRKEKKNTATKNIFNVFVDGELLSSACSEQKDIAKLNAAKEALQKLWMSESLPRDASSSGQTLDGADEIEGAKQKLIEFCNRKRWPKPSYSVEKEEGPSHDRSFICSVHIETLDGIYVTSGDVKTRRKDAENSAASMMIQGLKDTKHGSGVP